MKKWLIPALIIIVLLGLWMTGIASPKVVVSCLGGLCH